MHLLICLTQGMADYPKKLEIFLRGCCWVVKPVVYVAADGILQRLPIDGAQ